MSNENHVTVNGQPRSFAPGATLLDVIRSLNLEPERVAVELNRAIVRRDRWDATSVDAGAEIEIVQFVGGG
ncbi:MAG: sulfur carrier protein ThiS [Terriglobia bacterium]